MGGRLSPPIRRSVNPPRAAQDGRPAPPGDVGQHKRHIDAQIAIRTGGRARTTLGAVVYETDPAAAPDSDFAPGRLEHLVPGNAGRLLDARRTPIAVTAVSAARGEFEVEIGAFEAAGARWELPLQEVRRSSAIRAPQSSSRATRLSSPRSASPLRGALWRQEVPVDRLFMTFLETAAMNAQFAEAEAVILGDGASWLV